MKMKLILIFAILVITISPVMAGNNTTVVDNPTQYLSDEPMTEALESGDSNISFSDGYKGYCIEWGEHSAEKGDKFYVHDEDVDNNIKTFFVYFYEESQRDVIATQHMIWKFTDNKQFSKFNQTLYEKIIEKSATVKVPNDGVLKVNDTTEMVYSSSKQPDSKLNRKWIRQHFPKHYKSDKHQREPYTKSHKRIL